MTTEKDRRSLELVRCSTLADPHESAEQSFTNREAGVSAAKGGSCLQQTMDGHISPQSFSKKT